MTTHLHTTDADLVARSRDGDRAAFGVLVLARMMVGWQGRRAAWLSVLGFGSALVVLAFYLFRDTVG